MPGRSFWCRSIVRFAVDCCRRLPTAAAAAMVHDDGRGGHHRHRRRQGRLSLQLHEQQPQLHFIKATQSSSSIYGLYYIHRRIVRLHTYICAPGLGPCVPLPDRPLSSEDNEISHGFAKRPKRPVGGQWRQQREQPRPKLVYGLCLL